MASGTIRDATHIIKEYSKSYTVAGNGSFNLTADDLSLATPSGFKPVAAAKIGSGNTNVVLRYVNVEATGTNNVLGFRSVTSSSVTASASISILYLKL